MVCWGPHEPAGWPAHRGGGFAVVVSRGAGRTLDHFFQRAEIATQSMAEASRHPTRCTSAHEGCATAICRGQLIVRHDLSMYARRTGGPVVEHSFERRA